MLNLSSREWQLDIMQNIEASRVLDGYDSEHEFLSSLEFNNLQTRAPKTYKPKHSNIPTIEVDKVSTNFANAMYGLWKVIESSDNNKSDWYRMTAIVRSTFGVYVSKFYDIKEQPASFDNLTNWSSYVGLSREFSATIDQLYCKPLLDIDNALLKFNFYSKATAELRPILIACTLSLFVCYDKRFIHGDDISYWVASIDGDRRFSHQSTVGQCLEGLLSSLKKPSQHSWAVSLYIMRCLSM
jgi:hypothetical protein